MKNAFKAVKALVLLLFTAAIFQGCMKNEDPYAAYTPEREAKLISDWLAQMAANKEVVKTTPTGLNYILKTEGSGATVKAGDKVKVKYTGLFLDGSVFDDSAYYGDGTMTYVHKDSNSRMITGWEEGIEVMNKGAKAIFLIPSAKAYGTTGGGSIPKNTPLLFIIEVLDIS